MVTQRFAEKAQRTTEIHFLCNCICKISSDVSIKIFNYSVNLSATTSFEKQKSTPG
jgi:hypothetical protein